MRDQQSYGVLSQSSEDTLEFVVNGRVQRTWQLAPPLDRIPDLIHRCLIALGNEGWRPISHDNGTPETVVLARVPYTAGSKLSTFGTLRFKDNDGLVLTVSGAVMQSWRIVDSNAETLNRALAELEMQGWRVHRRYRTGATVVRG